MSEVQQLRDELSEIDYVDEIDSGMYTVYFSVNYGSYGSLPSEILELIVQHDGTLYSDDMCELQYTVVL